MLDIPSFAKPFRFEEMWLSDRGCSNIVEAVWLSWECQSDIEPKEKGLKGG